MTTKNSGDFLSHITWFQNVINENVILCGTSALECLDFFTGFINESRIDVYSLEKGNYDNINYNIVNSFDDIEYVQIAGIKCTSFEQTINDMLCNFEKTDEWALTEALSNYYNDHDESFDNLNIFPQNNSAFELVKQNAIDYYKGG